MSPDSPTPPHRPEDSPAKRIIRVVAAEIEEEGRFLLTQRRPQATFPLFWEFPSGKVEPEEGDEEALRRELMERLGVHVTVGERTMCVKQEYEDYMLDFCVYQCALTRDEPLRALKVNDWRWVHPQDMEAYPFPPADAESIRRLLLGSTEG